MTSSARKRRQSCPDCLRAPSDCFCRWIEPVDNKVELVLLQHPSEVTNPRGGARFLQRSMLHSRLAIGESYLDHELEELLYQPWCDRSGSARHPILLSRSQAGADLVLLEQTGAPSVAHVLRDPEMVRLLAFDGAERQSRRMLQQHPMLRALPTLQLPMPPDDGAARRTNTALVETVCAAFALLESDHSKYLKVVSTFAEFIRMPKT